MYEGVELRHLRYFGAVAEHLHFGRAAESLGITQPALSQQLRQLETLLDTTLLDRTSRTVRLTPAGTALLERATTLFDRVGTDLAEVVRVGQGEAGRLEVAFISSAARLVSSVLADLRRELPAVRAGLTECFTDDALHRLEAGLADVAFVRDPAPRPDLVAAPLLVEPFVAVVPHGHRLASRKTVTANDMRDDPLVFFPQTAGAHAHAVNLRPFRERGLEPAVAVAVEASHWTTILHLVADGAGVTLAPLSAVAPLPDGLSVIPLRGTTTRTAVHVLVRADDQRPITTRLCDIARRAAIGGKHDLPHRAGVPG